MRNFIHKNLILSLSVFAYSSSLMAKDGNGKVAINNEKQKLPNIVCFLGEDVSTHYLALYNNGKGALTPNLDELAKQGIIYTNAYSNAPVSSAARTTLITGCYAPRFAGSLHRKLKEMPMPEGLHMFPYYLREKGYFTCNASKTDYNVVLDKQAWNKMKGDLQTWRSRPDINQPFFYQRNNVTSHESKLQFNQETYKTKKTRYNPDNVYIHPTLPDTKLMRYTYATFYDRIQDTDAELGELVKMLKEDGVLDNTFIFVFGDNGGSLPGTKGYTNDIGFHVPMVVYVPKDWRDKVNVSLGSRNNDLVSFMDVAPTILNLAGVKVPEQMDGKPFLGDGNIIKSKYNYGYGDRFDELYAFNRVIRTQKYRYARNYQPYHTQSLYALYRYKQLAFQEWKDLFFKGKLNNDQSSFFKPFGPEELYDLENDPYELHNLVNDKKYQAIRNQLAGDLNKNILNKADLGFYPETIILEDAIANPDNFGNKHRADIKKYMDIADLQMESFKNSKKRLEQALSSNDAVERWWGLTTCASFGKDAATLANKIKPLLQDSRSFVRSRAFVALLRMGDSSLKNSIFSILDNCKTGAESLLVLNDFTYLVEAKLVKPFAISQNDIKQSCNGVDWRIKYLNSQNK